MRIHHLNCGSMRPLGGSLVDGEPGLLRRAEMVCHCLLVDTGKELVLVETGMGTRAVEEPDAWLGRLFTRAVGVHTSAAETAAAQVRALGYATTDVRHIVLTHLDLDHAGGLADFPHARVHVYAEELRALHEPRERGRYRAVQFAHGPRWQSHEAAGEPWFGFEAVRELPGGLLLVPLAGHTRGHAGVAVPTPTGWLLHAGDAYFHPGELHRSPSCPPVLAAFERTVQSLPRQRLANQRRLRELAAREDVTLCSAHSGAEWRALAGQGFGSAHPCSFRSRAEPSKQPGSR